MKVKMLVGIGGARNGVNYPPVGGIMDLLEKDEGRDLLDNGYAELLEEKRAPEIETAAIEPPENSAVVFPPISRKNLRK
jgi:hypothetical protein